jgi:hypothetical protein
VQDSEGVFYQNPAYDVSLRTPARWTVKNDTPNYILLAARSDRACSVALQPIAWSPLVGLGSFKGQLADQFSRAKDLTGEVLDEQRQPFFQGSRGGTFAFPSRREDNASSSTT